MVFKRKRLDLLSELAAWAEAEFADVWTPCGRIAKATPGNAVFLFTGTEHLAGTTTVALASCAGLARAAGIDTLLIETHPGKLRLSTVFKLSDEPGLTDLLQRPTAWREFVQPTPIERLHVITSGNGQLLEPGMIVDDLPALLKLAAQEFQAIVLDVPPLLEHSPFRSLMITGNHVVLVARHGRSRRESLRRTTDVIANCGAQLLCCVLNGYLPAGPSWMTPRLGST